MTVRSPPNVVWLWMVIRASIIKVDLKNHACCSSKKPRRNPKPPKQAVLFCGRSALNLNNPSCLIPKQLRPLISNPKNLMKKNLINRVLAVWLGIVSMLLAGVPSALADDLTWWGTGTSANFSDTLNWTNLALANAAPVNGDNLFFANASPQQIATNDLASLSAGAVTFTSGNFDLFGNVLTIAAGITNTANDNIFDLPLAFSTAQTFEIDASSLTFNRAITNNGNLTIAGVGSATWANGFATNVPVLGLRGSGNLIVNGPGSVTINGGFIYPSGSLNFAGNTIVNGGTLNMNAGDFDGNSQIGQSLTINPGGIVIAGAPHMAGSSGRPLSIYGGTFTMGAGSSPGEAYFTTVTLSNATLNVGGPGTGDLRGSGSFTNLASAGETIFGVSLNLTSSRVVGVGLGTVTSPDAGVDINFTGNGTTAITGSGNLTKVGSGKMLISGVANHTGTTTISAGTLALTGTMANTPTITVASNAVFDISGNPFSLSANQTLNGVGTVVGTMQDNIATAVISPGGAGVAGTLTMDGLYLNGNVNLNFDLANTNAVGGVNDLLVITNFALSGAYTNTVNFTFTGTPSTNAYTLIRSPNGNGIPAGPVTSLAAAASRSTYTFTSDTTNILVTVVANPAPLVWRGDGSTNNWDLNTSSNWVNGAVKDVFLTSDNATFNDTGSNTPPVNLVSALQANIVTVNATKDYTFAGSGKLTGSTKLLKSNSGNLTILTANDNAGGGGLNGTGTVTVGNGGTTAANIGSGTLTNNTKVTFFENASVTYAGNMSGTGSLTAFMPGTTLTLTGSNTFTGGTTIANGTLQIGNNSVASVAGNITNYSGLNIFRSDAFTNQNNITSAGITLEYGTGNMSVWGAGGMTVDGSGSINLLPQGSFSLANNVYGKLTVNAGGLISLGGSLLVGNTGSAPGNGDVIQNGGTINVGNQLRLGHYASEVSTYLMNGGTLNVPYGNLAVGWDGIGLMTMNNGTVNTIKLVVDDNGITPSYPATAPQTNSTFTLNGGTINIGTGGITSVSTTNTLVPTVVLSGGTIGTLVPLTLNSAGWSSSLYMRLTNGSPTIDTTNSVVTLSGILSGNGGLTKQGVGFLSLNGVNTYTNTTTVAAGTLQGSGTIVGPIVVNSGANISAGANLATGTLTTSNLTVNASGNMVFDLSSSAATSDLLYVRGALTLNSTPITLNFLGAGVPLTNVSYTIISNVPARSGSLTYANPTRYAATLDQSQAGRVQISFSGTNANLVWNGNVSTNWNVTENNWLNNGAADKYYQSDAVIFDNGGILTSNVNLAAAMTPASVTVDSTGNYTIAGSPIAGVTTLTKNGSGKLTLLNSNAYTGITTIAGGTLQVGNGGTVGALPVGGTVNDYSSLVFNRSDTATFNGIVNGPGSITAAGSGTLMILSTQNHFGGTTINSGSTVQLGNGPLADTGSLGSSPATNNGTVNFYRLSSVAVATPYTGGGNFNFLGTGNSGQSGYSLNATNTFTGPVTLSLARIQSGAGAQSFGSPSSITVNPGSQVYATATAVSPTYNIPLTLNGAGWQDSLGALRIESGATWTGTWAGNITLASNARIGNNTATTNSITGTIGGNYELETYGNNAATALILAPSSANTYNALRVSIGTAGAKTIAGNNNAIPNNIPLTMNGGTLWLNGFSKTFSSFLNLSGSSSIQNGSTTSPATVTLTPMLGSSTYNGTFADGASQPLNVTFTQTPGLWTLALPTLSPNWTGNLTNNGGTITTGASPTPFGSQSALGRSIVGNNGATFVTTINSPFNGYSGNLILNNSTWASTRFCSFTPNAGYIYLANSTLTGTNNTDGTGYAQLSLPSTVTVRGTAPSYLIGAGNSMGYGFPSSGTTFDVADATGNANSDLIVGGGTSTAWLKNAVNVSGCSLIKTGAGTMELDTAGNNYSGATIINAGTLLLGASATIPSTTSIIISNGATLDVSAISGGLTLNSSETLGGSGTVNGSISDNTGTVIQPGANGTAGTLTITNSLTLGGVGKLNIDLSNNTGSGNDQIVVGGALTVSGGTPTPVNFTFLNGAPAAGTYTLINCGSISGTVATAFTNTSVSRYTTTFSQVGNTVAVTFTGSASNLVWTGTDPLVPSTWDVATSTNWFDGSAANMFYQLDTVVFDDTSVNTNVTLNATVSPLAVTVNSTNNYAISGSGGIAGNAGNALTFTKNNTNTLTLNLASTFTGQTVVKAGKLSLAGTSPLGANLNTITVSNGAVLDFNGDIMGSSASRNYSYTVGGSGPDGNGALINSGGSIYSYANVSNLTLTANTVISAANRWDIGPTAGSTLNGNGFNLVKLGAGQLDMRPQYITNLASVTVSNGNMYYENSWMQTNAATLNTTNILVPGTSLGVYGGETVNMPVVANNAALLNQNNSGTALWTGNISVQGTNTFNNGGAQTFSGVISGPGAIGIGGGSTTAGTIPPTLTFSNASTFAGGLFLSNAPVTIGLGVAVAGNAAIVVNSSNGLGTGPINLVLSQMTTNAMTNTVRAIEFNIRNGGVIPNNIIFPAIASGVTNVGLQGRDSSSVFTLSGLISGGYTAMTNWVDFGDSGSSGVMRLANTGNTFVGNIYCDRGVLAITGDGCLGNAANLVKLDQASVNGGLRFDAAGINVAHSISVNSAVSLDVYGDNNGDGVAETGNSATISSIISGGGAITVRCGVNVTPSSSGTLSLIGNNSFTAALTVSPFTKVVASHANALGTTAGATTVSGGGTLSLNLAGTYASEPLTLNGGGVGGVGALENLSGTNILNGNVTLGAASTIGLTGGSLTLGGVISAAFPLTIIGTSPANVLTLTGVNTYSAGTIVNGGTLWVNGSLPVGNAVSVSSGGTLGGIGTINSAVTVQTGGTLLPGTNTVGKLTVNGPLNLFGNTVLSVNKNVSTNSVAGLSTVIYGGTLTVSNLGGVYAINDSFKLFSAQSYQGSFAATNLPNISPLAFVWTPTNGTLTVVNGVNLTPTNIVTVVSGNQLIMSWPADHTGWLLQAQTNSLSTGLNTNNWSTITGTDSNNSYTNTINPANPTVFYRLYHP